MNVLEVKTNQENVELKIMKLAEFYALIFLQNF